ncbi:MAG: PBSX family phage terminase large subunit [Oscillospiraceae bacterium]|nr:PBSX family phage terminase large subunit [Oscillospiraceae bacterium]
MSRLSNIVAPSFYGLYYDVTDEKYTHYWLKGGRGSTKSSFISVMIILGMMQNEGTNAVVIRKVANELKDSVYAQLQWAIDKLEVSEKWTAKLSPLELIYTETGQRIIFRGADKPKKLKSTKVSKGYIRYVWYEECDEFGGMQEIETINQSLMRGGPKFDVFYSYNPPKSQRNWVNTEVLTQRDDRLVHMSTYLTVPKEWLGEQFMIEAEHTKRMKPETYKHNYLGEVTGTGGEVFTNVVIERIKDEEISEFDKIKRGVDFGYAADPFVYIIGHYDSKRKWLYIFDEIYKHGLSNERAAEKIKEKGNYKQIIYCDLAEPKSINDLKNHGLPAKGAKKGPDSVEYGIKFLQSLERIIIDNERCPETAKEFLNYELEPDGNDGFKDGYPDKNNHAIDAVRYGMNDEIMRKKARIVSKKEFYG